MAPFNQEQLMLYFKRIRYPESQHAIDPLTFLTELQRHTLVRIPFETLSLHYSVDRRVSLDYGDLFEKIVIRGRGGYCLENNTLFLAMLQSLGFQATRVVCRITNATRGIYDGSWRAMSHMAIVVRVHEKRYLVDVGYGLDGPISPLPLDSNSVLDGLPGQQLKLERETLPQHQDSNQQVWTYSQRRSPDDWVAVYHFPDVEFFSLDMDVLNHYAMSQSLWARTVVAQRFVADHEESDQKPRRPSGTILLFRDDLRLSSPCTGKTAEKISSEAQRISMLEEHFSIHLTSDEIRAIHGRESELK